MVNYDVNQEDNTGYIDIIKKWINKVREWMKPDASDSLFVQILKSILKSIVLLVLIALSPVILVIMLFVFLAAL